MSNYPEQAGAPKWLPGDELQILMGAAGGLYDRVLARERFRGFKAGIRDADGVAILTHCQHDSVYHEDPQRELLISPAGYVALDIPEDRADSLCLRFTHKDGFNDPTVSMHQRMFRASTDAQVASLRHVYRDGRVIEPMPRPTPHEIGRYMAQLLTEFKPPKPPKRTALQRLLGTLHGHTAQLTIKPA